MATHWVYTCTGTRGEAMTLTGTEYGTCNPSSAGAWTQLEIAPEFNPADLNSEELGVAFSAGFVVMGTGLAIAWACRQLVAAIRSSI